ncbi:Amiloride-sensitive sodium channel subunit gamma [Plecturocebus cupreus]
MGRNAANHTATTPILKVPSSMAPGEKIKAKIKKNLPVTGPQAPTIKELMRWYCLNTNTHGCRRIVVSRGRLRRLLWIGFTLTAVALILWQCALLVFSFYTVSVSIKVHFRKLDFPAVTICNINPYKYSAVRHLLADLEQETREALKSLYGFPESRKRREAESWSSVLEGAQPRLSHRIPLLFFDQDEKGKARDFFTGRKRKVSGSVIHKASNVMHIESKQVVGFQLCSNDTSDCATYTFSSGINAIQEWYKLHYMNIMAQVPLEKKINMSYSAEELLVTCFFDGVSCDGRNFTLFHHPMHGNCYTFNNRENETILSTSMGGSEYGLQVILYINEEEYNPFLVSSTGAKVIIHRQDEYPFVEDVGTEIETAMVTSIGMHLKFETSLCKMAKSHLYQEQNTKIHQAWWHMPVVPATQEAEDLFKENVHTNHTKECTRQSVSLFHSQGLALSSRLKCRGIITDHRPQQPSHLGSCDPLASDFQLPGTTGTCHCRWGSRYVAQAGLKLLALNSPPTSASQSAGIIGMTHYT